MKIPDDIGRYFAIPAALAAVFGTVLSLYIPAAVFAVLLLCAVFLLKVSLELRIVIAAGLGFAPLAICVHPLAAGILVFSMVVLLLSFAGVKVTYVNCGMAAVFGIAGGFAVFFSSTVITACFVLLLVVICLYVLFVRLYGMKKRLSVKMKQ